MDLILKNIIIYSIIICEYEMEEKYVNITLNLKQIVSFKYSPTTSFDVERSFRQFKSILQSNRRSFAFENLKKPLIITRNNNN